MAIDPSDNSSARSGNHPGPTHTADDYRLPCGRRLEDLWARLDAAPNPPDTPPETALGTGLDAGLGTAPGAGLDAGSGAGLDGAPGGGLDAGLDAGPGAGLGAGLGTAPGAGLDSAQDEHERACPHCRTARESLLALRHATRRLVEEPIEPPVGLSGRIMAAVRAEIRGATLLPLPADTAELAGTIEISEQAIAVVLRFAADQVPGVRARRCTVRAQPDAPPGVLTVELAIALRYGTAPAERVLAAVRAAVADAAAAAIGVQIAHFGLSIEDIYT